MKMTKRALSIVLAAMMIVSMFVVGAVSASALDASDADFEITSLDGNTVKYVNMSNSLLNNGNGTYKMLRDTSTSYRQPFGTFSSDITLDLNGFTLTSTANDYVFGMVRGGSESAPKKLTIKSSKTGGKIVANALSASDSGDAFISATGKYNVITIAASAKIETTACGVALLGNNQTLNVTGGTLTVNGADFAIATNGSSTHDATINISGGTITSTGAAAIYQPSDGTLNISGGTITGTTGVYVKSGELNVTGGTIKGTGEAAEYSYNGSGANSTGDALVIDNCGYPGGEPDVTVTGGTFTSTNGDAVATYASQGETAVKPEITGGTFSSDVSGIADAELDYAYSYTNAAGKTTYYTKNFTSSTISGDGTYTLYKDVNVSARITAGILASNVTLDLNGHTITSTATDYGFLFSRAGSAAAHKSFTIKNGTYNGKQGIDALQNYVDVTIDNVTMNVSDNFAISTNGTYKDNNITVKDSTITSGSVAIYKPSSGSLTLENSNVTGTTAVYVKSGDVTINGGTYTGTGEAADYSYNGSGCNPTGDAVVIENAGSAYAALGEVAINNGTFTSTNASGILAAAKDDSLETPAGFINGGTFEGNVDNSYVAPGLVDVASTGGMFVIEPFVINGKADIDFYQRKAVKTAESEEPDGNDINTMGVRIATKVDQEWLEEYADEYGYVVAKYTGDKEQAELNFANLTKDGGNGQKTIDCTGTVNQNISGISDSTDDYVTLAVNGMDDEDKVVARFYVVVNGVTFYANYATYDGILATY